MKLILDIPDKEFNRYPQYYKPWIVNESVQRYELEQDMQGGKPIAHFKLNENGSLVLWQELITSEKKT